MNRKVNQGKSQAINLLSDQSSLKIWLDKVFHRVTGPAQWARAKLVRYADDYVVMARYIDNRVISWIETSIEGWLGLELNRQLRGWSNYFGQGYPRKSFREINSYVRKRLYCHLIRRSQRPWHPPKGVTSFAHFKKLGLIYL